MGRWVSIVIATFSLLFFRTAWCEDEAASGLLAIKGFGSIVASRTSHDTLGFRTQNQPAEVAFKSAGRWSIASESVLGVQADLFQHQEISATAQVLTTYFQHAYAEPKVELAFLRWRPAPDWQFRLGRYWIPAFMNSETAYVGFANNFIHQSLIYLAYPVSHLDGADVRYRHALGDGFLTTNVFVGRTRYDYPDSADGKEDYFDISAAGLSVTWENARWLLRTNYSAGNMARNGPATTTIITQVVPALMAMSGANCQPCAGEAAKWRRVYDGGQIRLLSLGARYASNGSSISGEWNQRTTDTSLPKSYLFNIELTHQLSERWLLYLNHLAYKTLTNNAPVLNLPAFAGIDALYAGQKGDRYINSVGGKYFLSGNVALRADVSEVNVLFAQARPIPHTLRAGVFQFPRRSQIFSLALDVVF